MDVPDVSKLLPQRYPFLLVDRVLELEPGRRAVAIKNVSINEPYFAGHFPGYPVVPGVLLVEMMSQVGGIALRAALAQPEAQSRFLGRIRHFRFRQPARPGDILRIESVVTHTSLGAAVIKGQITSDGRKVAEGEVVVAMPPEDASVKQA